MAGTKIRDVGGQVEAPTGGIPWANIVSPTAMQPNMAAGNAMNQAAGMALSASVKYGNERRQQQAQSTQAAEAGYMLGQTAEILTQVDASLQDGVAPQAVQNAAYARIAQIASQNKHLSPGDLLDQVSAARGMIKDSIGLKLSVNNGVATVANGYGQMKTTFDVASQNKNAMDDILKSVMKEQPDLGIKAQEIQIQMQSTQDPEQLEGLNVQMTGVVNEAKGRIMFDQQLATMKMQRELTKADAASITQVNNKQYAGLQNQIADTYLDYTGPAFTQWMEGQAGKDPKRIKSEFNLMVKNILSQNSVRDTLGDVGKSTDDLMSDLSRTMKIGEDMIDALSNKTNTQFQIDTITADARLKTLQLVGQDGLVKAGVVKDLGSIMNTNYVMARAMGDQFEETQFAAGIIGKLYTGGDAANELQRTHTLKPESMDNIFNSMRLYYNDPGSVEAPMDQLNTMVFAEVMAEGLLASNAPQDKKDLFMNMKNKNLLSLPSEARPEFDKKVAAMKDYLKKEE